MMKIFEACVVRLRAVGPGLVILAAVAVTVLVGGQALGLGLVAAFGMAFTAAIGRNPNEIRNPIADFFAPSTADVLPGRVERKEMVEEHGGTSGFVMRMIEWLVRISREAAAFMTGVHDRYAAVRVPEEVAKKRAELNAQLDRADADIQQLRDAIAVRRSNSFPSERHAGEGLRRTTLPEFIAKMNRLLDRLAKETLTRQRGIVVESARAGDDEPYLAVRFYAPQLVANEVLDDARTMAELTTIYTARAGTKQWLASAETAVGLSAVLLDRTRDFVAGLIGPDPNREMPLETPDGRLLPRARQ